LAALIAPVIWPMLNSTSANAATSLSLERFGGTVFVEFSPAVDKEEAHGSFALLVRNTTSKPLRPRLTLDPVDAGAPVLRMHLVGPPPAAPRLRSTSGAMIIAPGVLARLTVQIDIPAATDPHSLEGTLVLHAVTPSLVPVGVPTAVPIDVDDHNLSTVTVIPNAVTLHTTTWIPWGDAATGRSEDIELQGIGAEYLMQTKRIDGRGLLHSESGQTVSVELAAEHLHDGPYQPSLHILGRPEAGTYTGVVPISAGSDSPTLSVTVVSHDAIIWALAAVALGTFLGGLLPLLGERARQRTVLWARLQGQLLDYFAVAGNDKVMKWDDLSDAVGDDRTPWSVREWMAEPDSRGAAGLFFRLRSARNEEELKSIGKDIDALIDWIARWLALEPKVLALDRVQQVTMRDLNGIRWASTTTRTDSQSLVLDAAWVEPTATEVAAKKELLQRQTEWHHEVAAAWQQLAVAWEKLQPSPRDTLFDELKVLCFASPAVKRSTEEWTDLRIKLADFLSSLVAVLPEGRLDTTALMVEYVQPSVEEVSGSVAGGIRTSRQRASKFLLALPDGIRKATVRLRRRSTKPAKMIASAQRQTILLSVLAATGAMLVYALQIYTETWGTPTDYLAAVAAGFGAQAIVRWAALPIFESWDKRYNEPNTEQAAKAN
jgi:hypothetical protein